MREKIRRLYADTLFQNSFYLMLNTGVMAALGFVFWIICAHLFSPSQVGVATSLISAMSLISYASALGFNSTFTRFLPTSKTRSDEINTGLILVIGAAIVIASIYVIVIPYTTPALNIIQKNIWYSIGFVAMVALAAINLLTDSIFIAYRAAKYNLLIDGGIQGLIKITLPFVYVGLGAYGVFAASGSAAAAAMVASIIFLAWKFEYKAKLKIDMQAIRKVFSYSSTNYIANLLNIAPTLVLPLIIISKLGAADAGYYYLSFAVVNLLYAIATSVSQSLFAEGAYGEVTLIKLLKRAILIVAAIMVPSGLILATLGTFVLQVFGKSYSVGGAHVIVVLALAAPAVAAYVLGNVILRIKNQLRSIIIVNVVYFLSISGLALLWVGHGLVWVAGAWLVGNLTAGIVAFLSVFYYHHKTYGALTL